MKKNLVRAFSAVAASGLATALLVAPASAVTVNFTSTTTVTDTLPNPVLTYVSGGLNGPLSTGSPLLIPDFIEATFGNNSFNSPGSFVISAAFTFTVPTPSGATTDTGSISAQAVVGKSVTVTWTDPLTFIFTDGTQLLVNLQDTTYNCNDSNCNNESFSIGGTFELLNGPQEEAPPGTPLPAAVWLMGTILAGGAGVQRWRRKRGAKLAAS